MTGSADTDGPSERTDKDIPKLRRCLRCQAEFESEWAGERICLRCKGSNAWRAGLPVRSFSSGDNR